MGQVVRLSVGVPLCQVLNEWARGKPQMTAWWLAAGPRALLCVSSSTLSSLFFPLPHCLWEICSLWFSGSCEMMAVCLTLGRSRTGRGAVGEERLVLSNCVYGSNTIISWWLFDWVTPLRSRVSSECDLSHYYTVVPPGFCLVADDCLWLITHCDNSLKDDCTIFFALHCGLQDCISSINHCLEKLKRLSCPWICVTNFFFLCLEKKVEAGKTDIWAQSLRTLFFSREIKERSSWSLLDNKTTDLILQKFNILTGLIMCLCW